MVPQKGGNHKKPQRFGPEVVSGKIVNPGIDQKNMWFIACHRLKFEDQ
jgi:hypothetical protein